MRFAIIIGLAAGISVGCASKNKTETAPATAAPAKAAATMEKAKADAKTATKDAKKAAKEAVKETKEAAATAAASATGTVECKLKNETRTLEVRSKDKGCETAYTKAGQENVVGSSMNGTAHCEGIVTKIKEKLAAAGYSCN